jgi:acetyl esterase/lipase
MTRARSVSLVSLLVLVLTAAWVAPTGAAAPRGPAVIENVAYAPAQPAGSVGHLLDLYLPRSHQWARTPLVIWSSGSAWFSDNGKAGAADVAEFFNERGYAVAGVSVRSSFQAQFPGQVHDVKAAIRWLRAHAWKYRLDPSRFAIMGNSSGGWLTAMAALTGGVRQLEGNLGVTGVSSRVQAAVAFYPPTDFLQMDAHMIDCGFFNAILNLTDCHNDPLSPESRLVGCAIQTCPDRVAEANPINYVTWDDPPITILHGQADLLVPHHQSELLYAALRRNCNTAAFFSIPNVGHEHPYVTDPSRAEDHIVRFTRRCHKELTSFDAPEPTWATLEHFLRYVLNSRRFGWR